MYYYFAYYYYFFPTVSRACLKSLRSIISYTILFLTKDFRCIHILRYLCIIISYNILFLIKDCMTYAILV